MQIRATPGANIVATVDRIKAVLPQLREQIAEISPHIDINVSVDRTQSIRASLADVERTLLIAITLVVLVVLLFLRNGRATLIPAVATFFALPIEVRHVTLSTGQLAAAVGAEGFGLMRHAPFWWCVAGIVVTGMLNVGVSFFLAFRVALRSRGIRLADRSRIYRAVRRRLGHAPLSFIWPPREPAARLE